MKEAVFKGKVISALEGLAISGSMTKLKRPNFKCVECGEAARVHKAGGHQAEHFEHCNRNQFCKFVHQPELAK